jgi:hypothetical protein
MMGNRNARRLATRVALGVAIGAALSAAPATVEAHCCKELATVRLTPVDPAARPRLSGRATVLDCFGVMSLVSVKVSGRVTDGTQVIPVLPGAEPLLGDWFTMTGGQGEGFIQNVTPPLTGRTIEVDDDTFTAVLTGTF